MPSPPPIHYSPEQINALAAGSNSIGPAISGAGTHDLTNLAASAHAEHHGHDGSDNWILGLWICVCANIITNTGLILQKYSLERGKNDAESLLTSSPTDENKVTDKPAKKCQSIWWFGLALYLGGQVGSGVSLGLAPLSILGCLGPTGLVLKLF